jgi:hypothetical protein
MTRGDLRWAVINRDRQCVAALLDRAHLCRDRWGNPASPTDTRALTLEHVHQANGRTYDDPLMCVADCYHANVVERWESANRATLWAYLAGVRAGSGMA